jgi:pimeloyl-ACP methyl ester carboxylesterase
MAEAREGHLQAADGRLLTYRDNGDPAAAAVVDHHGTPGSRLDGHPDEDAMLAELGLRIVTYDRPGYGASDPHPSPPAAVRRPGAD